MLRLTTYQQYRKAVMAVPPLAASDSRELAWLAWKGDKAAKREMVERHLWIVVEVAERLRPWQTQAFESLVGAGNLALVRAVDLYCPWDKREFTEYVWDILQMEMSKEALPTA